MEKHKTNHRSRFFIFFFLSLTTFLTSCSSMHSRNDTSQLNYTYARLKVMDLDEMSQLMLNKAREYKKTEDPQKLKSGLLICLSRPDEDAVVEKIISTIRNPMEDENIWEFTVEELVDESITHIKEDKLSSADQVTYSIVLENIIAEMRPNFIRQYKSPGFETKIIEKIAKANVELSSSAQAERKLNLMKGSFSASQVAQKMLDRREDYLKQEKKAKMAPKDEKIEAP